VPTVGSLKPTNVHLYSISCFSSMLAVARDDFVVNIIDIDTRKVVRKFAGHDNRLTDMVNYFLILNY